MRKKRDPEKRVRKSIVKRAVVARLKQRRAEAVAAGDEPAAARAEAAIMGMARRKCSRGAELFGVPPCTKTYSPPIGGSKSPRNTCSAECAMLMMAQRENEREAAAGGAPVWRRSDLAKTIDAMAVAPEEIERLRRLREERSGRLRLVHDAGKGVARVTGAVAPRGAKEEQLERVKGPRRRVAEVLREGSTTTQFARMECGHEAAVPRGASRYRCRKCRGSELPISPGAAAGVPSETGEAHDAAGRTGEED